MARPYMADELGGLDLAPIGGQARAALPRVRADLPNELFPPALSRPFYLHLAAAIPSAAAVIPAPKVSDLADDFGPDQASFVTRWPRDYTRGTPGAYYNSEGDYDPSQGRLSWYTFYQGSNGWGAGRGSATAYDATTALITLDIGAGAVHKENGSGGTWDGGVTFQPYYEDRGNNLRLRFKFSRSSQDVHRVALATERSEGAEAAEFAGLDLADSGSARPVRRVRFGFNPDGTARVQVLRTAVGTPEVWEGLASVPLPNVFGQVFAPGSVYLHLDAVGTGGYQGLNVAKLRGTRPLGAISAPADLPAVGQSMLAPVGGPGAGAPFVVPDGHVAQLDCVEVALLTVAAGPPVAGATPHAAADLWMRVLVDGSPAPGMGELRPTLLLLGAGSYPAGQTFARRYRPRLTLKAGQRLTAELVTRDSAANHAAECVLSGWLYPTEAE